MIGGPLTSTLIHAARAADVLPPRASPLAAHGSVRDVIVIDRHGNERALRRAVVLTTVYLVAEVVGGCPLAAGRCSPMPDTCSRTSAG